MLAKFYIIFLEIWIRQVIHGPIWFTDKYGVTCRLYPEDRLAFYLAQKAFFGDEGMLILTKRLLKPNMTVFDVGAYWGAHCEGRSENRAGITVKA
jgi:hypothetical protein